jgi:hypothetical protein
MKMCLPTSSPSVSHHNEPLDWKTIAIPEEDAVFRSRCLRAVLDAVVKSGVELETFSMGKEKSSVSLSKCANVPYPALQLPVEYVQRLGSCFSNLESVTLSIISDHHRTHRLPGWENALSRFISSAPNLKHLTLSLDRKVQVSHHSARIVRSLSDSVYIEGLESLYLCNTTAHESDLAKLVKTHAAPLQRLNLANVCILTGNWLALLTSFKSVHNLSSLRLADIEGRSSPVQFRHREKERQKVTLDTTKNERTMDQMLDDLIGVCSVESVAAIYA